MEACHWRCPRGSLPEAHGPADPPPHTHTPTPHPPRAALPQFLCVGAICGMIWWQVGQSVTLYGAQNARGLLFFEG